MDTLPDYLREGLRVVSIGLNPSPISLLAGFYFANPRNRFWPALNASGLVPELLTPGIAAQEKLFNHYRIGFTDVVKRASPGGVQLRAADFRTGAPLLRKKLLRYRPSIMWFHGKVAYGQFVNHTEDQLPAHLEWGLQPNVIGASRIFVTPNPSPANAAFSLAVLTQWYRTLAAEVESAVIDRVDPLRT